MCSFAKKEQQEGIPSCCSFFLREKGLEPPRHGHQILSLARLPIPPFPLIECYCLLFVISSALCAISALLAQKKGG